MAKPKTTETSASVEDFIASVKNVKKRQDGLTILKMMDEITGKEAKMWGPSIIGFGSYHYIYDSGHERDSPLIAFSPRAQSLVLYVLNNSKTQKDLLAQLGKYKTGKVCLYINKLDDIVSDILDQLIRASWKSVCEKYS